MRRKDVHQGNTVRDQGRYPKRPSLSLNEKTTIQGEDLPGNLLQARSSTYDNFGAPIKQGTFWGQARDRRNPPDDSKGKYQPGNKSGYHQEYRAERKPQQLAQKFPLRVNPPKIPRPLRNPLR